MTLTRIQSLFIVLMLLISFLFGCKSLDETLVSSGENSYLLSKEKNSTSEAVESEETLTIETAGEEIFLSEDGKESYGWGDDQSSDCYGSERHKIGQGIADKFEVPYEQIMSWFCGGSQFEDILLALQTSRLISVSTDELLVKRANGQKWDDIWEVMGMQNQR
jgi:hypothetical protein